nr:glycoside hydrolase family 88 protein [uncultured Draconibacterium sp.]
MKISGNITSLLVILLCFFYSCQKGEKAASQIVLGTVHQKELRAIPEENRVAFNWKAAGMFPGDTVLLTFNEEFKGQHNWLRLTVAQEIWDRKRIHASIPGTEINLGTFDIKYSSVLVPYEIEIPQQYLSQITKNGISLVLESKSPFWFFEETSAESPGLVPHILSAEKATGAMNDFLDCFLSENSVQAFGWREGTVLDGLWQLYTQTKNEKALQVIQQHLNLFFDDSGNLVYENAGSKPNDNRVDGIESTIPFATLSRLQPEHPILDTVIDGWQELKKENGMIIDGNMVSAEGCYTISYPMAVMGKTRQNKTLIEEAQAQLKHRFVLINDGDFYLRYYTNGRYTYKNWARGAAWFLLGYVRTIEELGIENIDIEIANKFKDAVDIALSMQRPDGLWSCFMDDPANSLPDASGSAGIAAAVMSGINLGILPVTYQENVEDCYKSLQNYITPDGFLKGVAQDNRGGEMLQRSDYRVIAQMGMGMMAQLYAALYQKDNN